MSDKLDGLRRNVLRSMGVSVNTVCIAADENGKCYACDSRRAELAAFEAAILENAKEESK